MRQPEGFKMASAFSPGAPPQIERIARRKGAGTREAVADASRRKVEARARSLEERIHDPQALRRLAAAIRQYSLDHLDSLLEEAERNLIANGARVYWARDAAEACRLVIALCARAGARTIAKAKSMVSEEIHLNAALERAGFHPVETDLGEFVVQIDHDTPTHIVTPIIHKNRRDVARSFAREGLGEYTEDPEALAAQARAHLREVFYRAEVGLTGANFIAADTGRIVITTNEGNGRMCATAPPIHIVLTGIEKVVARECDLAAPLKMLARSSTGQDLTVSTQFLGGPAAPGSPDGPRELHVIFLDNGRSRILAGPCREILRCIRCGACLNVCPVYRQVTGHAYQSMYSGPMGAVLSPLLGDAPARGRHADLPFASTLCGACEEVCPVMIPIPRLLLALRASLRRRGLAPAGSPPFAPWSWMARSPALWRAGLAIARRAGWRAAERLPGAAGEAFRRWSAARDWPAWPRQTFREWWKTRAGRAGGGRRP